MIDLVIWQGWNEERGCNVFRVRNSMHPAYQEMYGKFTRGPANRDGSREKAVYPSSYSIYSDFPWDYFVFFTEDDEKNFVEEYAPFIQLDRNSPPKNWARPTENPGVKWCDRCKVFHEVRDPSLPSLEDELAATLADEITREIDAEIMAELMALVKPCDHEWKDNSDFHEGYYTYVCKKCNITKRSY